MRITYMYSADWIVAPLIKRVNWSQIADMYSADWGCVLCDVGGGGAAGGGGVTGVVKEVGWCIYKKLPHSICSAA